MKTDLEIFVEEEALKQRNTAVPVKASFIERLFVRRINPQKLRPNPEDEFCFPDIGPNMGIISSYVSRFVDNKKKALPLMDEPLYVQKIRPSGYMILNGHHRWMAALRLSVRSVPISIVNGVYEGDIKKILEASTHEKRATIDLDEVIFAPDGSDTVEKRRGIPLFGLQKKRLSLGVPALIQNLRLRGYDIWVYSANFFSVDDIRRFFAHYAVSVDGIVTGLKGKSVKKSGAARKMEELFKNKYSRTLHIDREMVLSTNTGSGDFREEAVQAPAQNWSSAVIDAIDRIERDEK